MSFSEQGDLGLTHILQRKLSDFSDGGIETQSIEPSVVEGRRVGGFASDELREPAGAKGRICAVHVAEGGRRLCPRSILLLREEEDEGKRSIRPVRGRGRKDATHPCRHSPVYASIADDRSVAMQLLVEGGE